MKKKLSILAVVVMIICLAGAAFDWFVPASAVHAASETNRVTSSTGVAEKNVVSLTRSTQPAVLIITGLVCALFGVIAISPLLIGDPARLLEEANRTEQ